MTARAWILIGMKYLFGKKEGRGSRHLRGAVVGIALSLVPVVVVLVVADGMIEGITARYIEIGTYHLQAQVRSPLSREELSLYAEAFSGVPGVTGAYHERQGFGLVSAAGGRSGATVRAVPPTLYEQDQGLARYMRFLQGSFDLSDPGAVLIGSGLAESLGVSLGDRVTLVTMRNVPGRPFVPRLEQLTVRGVFSTGYHELDSLWVYIPIEKGLRVLDPSASWDLIGIKTDRPFDGLTGVQAAVARLGGVDFRIATWYDLEKSQYMSFQTTKTLLLFIMYLIVCVAAVNISSSMVMLVIEKRQEIGILKSIGASPRGIERVFMAAGLVIGIMGTGLGITAGLLAAVNINGIIRMFETVLNAAASVIRNVLSPTAAMGNGDIRILNPAFYLETIPVNPDAGSLIGIAAFSIALSTFVSYFPARGAGKIRPLDVLRKY
jgi:lipoprotein-releasing system permease protein